MGPAPPSPSLSLHGLRGAWSEPSKADSISRAGSGAESVLRDGIRALASSTTPKLGQATEDEADGWRGAHEGYSGVGRGGPARYVSLGWDGRQVSWDEKLAVMEALHDLVMLDGRVEKAKETLAACARMEGQTIEALFSGMGGEGHFQGALSDAVAAWLRTCGMVVMDMGGGRRVARDGGGKGWEDGRGGGLENEG